MFQFDMDAPPPRGMDGWIARGRLGEGVRPLAVAFYDLFLSLWLVCD